MVSDTTLLYSIYSAADRSCFTTAVDHFLLDGFTLLVQITFIQYLNVCYMAFILLLLCCAHVLVTF